jgi:hypothetical protein
MDDEKADATGGSSLFSAVAGGTGGGSIGGGSSGGFKSPRLQQLMTLKALFSSKGIMLDKLGLLVNDSGPEEGEMPWHVMSCYVMLGHIMS